MTSVDAEGGTAIGLVLGAKIAFAIAIVTLVIAVLLSARALLPQSSWRRTLKKLEKQLAASPDDHRAEHRYWLDILCRQRRTNNKKAKLLKWAYLALSGAALSVGTALVLMLFITP